MKIENLDSNGGVGVDMKASSHDAGDTLPERFAQDVLSTRALDVLGQGQILFQREEKLVRRESRSGSESRKKSHDPNGCLLGNRVPSV